MAEHGSYYVPHKSSLPIVNAIGMFFFGLGSVEVMTSPREGMILIGIGTIIIFVNLCVWFAEIIRESQAGLHDAQMNRTYRWGMFWFLFAQAFLLLTFLGAMGFIRIFSLPGMAGIGPYPMQLTHLLMWPNFVDNWPLLVNPNPQEFPGPLSGPPINWFSSLAALPLLITAVLMAVAQKSILAGKQMRLVACLVLVCIAGLIFAVMHAYTVYTALVYAKIILSSGIYGTLFFTINFVLALNLVVALIFSLVVMVRAMLGHFTVGKDFSIEASAWLWYFLLAAWIIVFVSLFF